MRVSIDAKLCQGHGRCYEIAPEIFVDDEEGMGVVRDPEVRPEWVDRARAAVNACPEGAVSLRRLIITPLATSPTATLRCGAGVLTGGAVPDDHGLQGKVAFITGAAQGQGRAHAERLASHGVDVIAVDLCADVASMDYPNATPADLEETVELVEKVGAGIVAGQAKVNDLAKHWIRVNTIHPTGIKFITGVALPLDAGFTIR